MGGVVEPVDEPTVVVTILGTAGNDTLNGSDGAESIVGLAGNDLLFGGLGPDSLYGGDGDDYLVYAVGDHVFGGTGIDTVYFDLSARGTGITLSNVTSGSPFEGIETLTGNLTGLNDRLFAGALGGPDPSGLSFVYAGAGQDSLVLDYGSIGSIERVVVSTSGGGIFAGRYQGSTQLGSADLHEFEAVTLRGSLGDDYIDLSGWVGGAVARLFGGAGDDDLRASAAASNLLYGGDGNDALAAMAGNGAADSLYGGSGDDTFWFVTRQDQVFGGAGVDSAMLDLSASTASVTIGKIFGAEFSDIENFYGRLTNYADSLRLVWQATAFGGGSGQLDAGAANGSGSDSLVLDFGHITDLGYAGISTSGTGVGTAFGVEMFGTNGALSDDLTYLGFERVTLLGSAGNDSLLGVDLAETLRGRDGDDWLRGGRYGDLLDGGAGNDTVQGDESGAPGGSDTLFGGSGDDRLEGEAGNDLLYGGEGADELFGGDGDLQAYGGSGGDTLWGWSGNDLLNGGSGNDSLDAESGADSLHGGAGDDWLGGGSGADLLTGADDDDSLFGDSGFDDGGGDDSLYGGDGNDLLSGDGGSDLLNGGAGNDVLRGGSDFAMSVDDDSLFGGSGDDLLLGFDGNDLLSGGVGNDSLRAGNGSDVLTGGAGVDRFIFDYNAYAPDDHDTITDYTAGEVISFARFTPFGPADFTITQNGADQLISWGNGTLTLLNYTGAVSFAFNADLSLG